MIKLKDVSSKVRQIAIKNIGRDEPTLLITNDLTTPGKNLFARYAERMMVENELDAYIGGFHLDALTSGVPLNVDLDTTLTVVAGNLYRLLALKLSRYERATPETLWRDFLDATGTLHIDRHRRHLRAEPAQPPPRPHRRRIRRPANPDPLVGRPHPPVPVPATVTTSPQRTSTQLSDRESRLERTVRSARSVERGLSGLDRLSGGAIEELQAADVDREAMRTPGFDPEIGVHPRHALARFRDRLDALGSWAFSSGTARPASWIASRDMLDAKLRTRLDVSRVPAWSDQAVSIRTTNPARRC